MYVENIPWECMIQIVTIFGYGQHFSLIMLHSLLFLITLPAIRRSEECQQEWLLRLMISWETTVHWNWKYLENIKPFLCSYSCLTLTEFWPYEVGVRIENIFSKRYLSSMKMKSNNTRVITLHVESQNCSIHISIRKSDFFSSREFRSCAITVIL